MCTNKRVLILSFSDLARDPRVRRQMEWLKARYHVTAAGLGDPGVEGVRYLALQGSARPGVGRSLARGIAWAARRFETLYWLGWRVQNAWGSLAEQGADLLVANDLNTLLLALRIAQNTGAKVLLDAHEYAPRRVEDRLGFRVFWKRYWDFICREYLPRVDAMVTVSQGIADEYTRQYGVACRVVTTGSIK